MQALQVFTFDRKKSAFCLLVLLFAFSQAVKAQFIPFEGAKSTWHEGFDRYDFMMDEQSLAIIPFKAPEGEGFGVKDPPNEHRRCIVIVPKKFAPGYPWTWRGCYWDHQPQAEIEMLKRGFCVAYISASGTLRPGKEWDAWYKFLVEHGLSPKPCFIGMSRGGEFSYIWATGHPNRVSAIYVDNPGGNYNNLLGMGELARYDVPILHVCGSIDPILGQYSTAYENIYKEFGGRISVMIKEGFAHHPHSLRDPKLIADFLEQSVYETLPPIPSFIKKYRGRVSYYSSASIYKYVPAEGTFATFRGPYFTGCYAQYEYNPGGVESFATVIVPNKPAPGNPWVYRSGFLKRDASVDQTLLAKGYYIVTGPVPYGVDGPTLKEWNTVYKSLINAGFSKKPIMQGEGEAAGEVIAWATENPDKVAAVYAENPILKTKLMSQTQPMDNLTALARAHVPIFFVSGKLDPSYTNETLATQKRYKQLGGKITVLTIPDGEHYLIIKDTKPEVDFIENSNK
jgi:pimeloyl-ACP methyl ester carboxylesterase